MRLYIRTLLGEIIDLEVEESQNIEQIKKKIEMRTGVGVNKQTLLLAGKMLTNVQILSDIGVTDNYILDMLLINTHSH